MKKRMGLFFTAFVFILSLSVGVFAETPVFLDIRGHWAEQAVTDMAKDNIVKGYPDGTFVPEGMVTRAEFAQMLFNAVGTRTDHGEVKNPFVDVKVDWYYDAVISLYNDGVITGTTETTFDPLEKISREQMFTLVFRAQKAYGCFDLSIDEAKKITDFKDYENISDFALEGMTYSYQTGLLQGLDQRVQAKSPSTRGQVAVVLHRCLYAEKELPTEISQEDWVAAKQYVQLSTGITMAYVEMGNPEGKNLVIVHGTTDSSRANSVMSNYICKKSSDYHLYVVDLRGSGNSDAPRQKIYTCSMFAEDLNAFFHEMGIEKAFLTGHSLGSRVCTIFAATYPEKIEKLALMGTSLTTPETQYGARGDEQLAMQTSPEFLELKKTAEWLNDWDYVTPGILEGKEYKDEVEKMMTYIKQETGNIAIEAYTSTLRARALEDFTNIYRNVTMETLFLHGENDYPATNAAAVMSRVPHSVGIVIYPGCGHSIEWERPAEVAQDLIDFFDGVEKDYPQDVASAD